MENRINVIPSFETGIKVGVYDCKDECYMEVFNQTTKEDYEAYQSELEKQGFLLHDKYQMRENYHATYVKADEVVLHIYYTACDLTTRIIVDSNTLLPRKTKEEINKIYPTTEIYQLELDYRNIDCGMCYITKCEDGSFFIVDSAHQDSVNDHIRIHEFLRSLTPEGEQIVIAGWFFSHAHQDHIYKFMDFIKAGFHDYKIECLYYNFPSLASKGNEKWKEDDKVTMREFDAVVEQLSEVNRVKLHTGQHFYIRNLEFEVLVTHEDVYPNSIARFNDTSTIIRMKVGQSTVLFLGDGNVAESDILVKRYGDYLESDIVQISHHGYNGATPEVYECVKAPVALFPVIKYRLEENMVREANQKAMELCKEHYIGSEGTVRLSLPYELGSAVVLPKEIF